MIIIPNVNKENSCLNCPVWSLCWDNKPVEDINKDRCPILQVDKYAEYEIDELLNPEAYDTYWEEDDDNWEAEDASWVEFEPGKYNYDQFAANP